MGSFRLLEVALGVAGAAALNNGQGRLPAMGFSSWNAFGPIFTSDMMKNITRLLQTSGLAAKGYRYINCDEGQDLHANLT